MAEQTLLTDDMLQPKGNFGYFMPWNGTDADAILYNIEKHKVKLTLDEIKRVRAIYDSNAKISDVRQRIRATVAEFNRTAVDAYQAAKTNVVAPKTDMLAPNYTVAEAKASLSKPDLDSGAYLKLKKDILADFDKRLEGAKKTKAEEDAFLAAEIKSKIGTLTGLADTASSGIARQDAAQITALKAELAERDTRLIAARTARVEQERIVAALKTNYPIGDVRKALTERQENNGIYLKAKSEILADFDKRLDGAKKTKAEEDSFLAAELTSRLKGLGADDKLPSDVKRLDAAQITALQVALKEREARLAPDRTAIAERERIAATLKTNYPIGDVRKALTERKDDNGIYLKAKSDILASFDKLPDAAKRTKAEEDAYLKAGLDAKLTGLGTDDRLPSDIAKLDEAQIKKLQADLAARDTRVAAERAKLAPVAGVGDEAERRRLAALKEKRVTLVDEATERMKREAVTSSSGIGVVLVSGNRETNAGQSKTVLDQFTENFAKVVGANPDDIKTMQAFSHAHATALRREDGSKLSPDVREGFYKFLETGGYLQKPENGYPQDFKFDKNVFAAADRFKEVALEQQNRLLSGNPNPLLHDGIPGKLTLTELLQKQQQDQQLPKKSNTMSV